PLEARDVHRRGDRRRILRKQFRYVGDADIAELEDTGQSADVRILECGSGLRRQTPWDAARLPGRDEGGEFVARRGRTFGACAEPCDPGSGAGEELKVEA